MTSDYERGWIAAVKAAADIADRWRDENRAAAAKARKRAGTPLENPGMADMLEGAATECNAISAAIRDLAPLNAGTLTAGEQAAEARREEAWLERGQ